MTTIATVACLVVAVALVLHAGVRALRNQSANRIDEVIALVLEVAVLVYFVSRVVELAGGHRTQSLAIVIPYLIGLLLIMPIAVALSRAEPTRWGSVIMVAGALVVAVLFARINQIWTPRG